MLVVALSRRSFPQVIFPFDSRQFQGVPCAWTKRVFGGRESVTAYAARGKTAVSVIENVISLSTGASARPLMCSATSMGM